MSYKTSDALAEIRNLTYIANYHRKECKNEDCQISIWLLGMTAKRLVEHCWMHERNEARRIIGETSWT